MSDRREKIKRLKRRGDFVRVLVSLPPALLVQLHDLHPHVERTYLIRTILTKYVEGTIRAKKDSSS